jgi:hypothetical protein
LTPSTVFALAIARFNAFRTSSLSFSAVGPARSTASCTTISSLGSSLLADACSSTVGPASTVPGAIAATSPAKAALAANASACDLTDRFLESRCFMGLP